MWLGGWAPSVGSQACTPRRLVRPQPLITSTTSGKNVIQLWQGRSCMNCHTKVHGSNNPSATPSDPAAHAALTRERNDEDS
jgi:hypothetical protein